ncbi:hypothetical protein [Natrinema sp. 1APR25-10V2]|uniref:hypothetical protein n=1 Tax=Natrinema sp. 1APR25-10V2 TaxID=2951081 RepID=UPI0028750B59|nr:hypothetical protein [Natrinema sp. 1APR25-10V2]MDS0475303.1 hypothetical protein [Natrinema sp. 1APR25-10V2]
MPSDSTSDDRLPAEAIVESIRTAPMPVVNTRYLADEYGVPLDEMGDRLAELAADGVLETHEIEGRGRIWWLSLEADLRE